MNKSAHYLDPENRVLNPLDRRIEPTAGDKAIGAIGQVKRVDVDRRAVSAIMSSGALDRHGEIIDPEAYREHLPLFMTNPVLLADHDHTRQIGHWENVRITGRGLEGEAIFARTPEAESIFALYRDGHRRAFSVGVLIHEYEMREMRLGEQVERVRVFTKVELVECSAVAVPANPEALVASLSRGRQAGGGGQRVNKGEQLGQRVREAREAAGLTVEQLAARLPITMKTLARVESGELVRPADDILEAIAEALDLDAGELTRLADADAEAAGVEPGDTSDTEDTGGSGGGDRSLSNRKAKALIHREIKPVLRSVAREVLREELGHAIDDLELDKLAAALEGAGGSRSGSPAAGSASRSTPRGQRISQAEYERLSGEGDLIDADDASTFWGDAFEIFDAEDEAADEAAALEELAQAFAGD